MKGWNWLNEGIYPLALTIMRVCLLWLWLALIQGWLLPSKPEALLPIGLMTGLLLGSMALTRWSIRRTKSLNQARLIVAGLGVVTLLLLLWWQLYRFQYPLWDLYWLRAWRQEIFLGVDHSPPSYLVLPVIVYLWLRGIIDGSRLLERKDIVNTFTLSSISLVVWLLVTRLDNQERPEETGVLILLFFATALLGLTFSSLETGYFNIVGQEQLQLSLNRYWLATVSTIIVILLGVALLLSAVLVPESITQVLGWSWMVISQILLFLVIVFSLILYPLLYLLAVILQPILERIFSRYNVNWPKRSELLPEGSNPADLLAGVNRTLGNLPDEFSWVGLILFILGIGLLFMLALQYLLARPDRDGVEEKRDFIFSKELLLSQLSQIWPQKLNHSIRYPFLALTGEPDPRRVIREIYQGLLAATREQGSPRLRHQTPTEYEHGLSLSLSGSQEALEVITAGYIQARYGSKLPTQEQVEQVQQAKEQLQTTLQVQETPSFDS